MKVSRKQAAENRERIVGIAAQLLRERGLEGMGVSDLMKTAGLTHGGFYGHFASKEALMAEAAARAIADSLAVWNRRAEASPDSPLSGITAGYLSERHRDHPGQGCLIAALGSEASRHGLPLRRTFTEGVRSFAAILTRLVPGHSEAAKREKALSLYAGLVGAVILSRAVDDPALSDEILQAVSASISDP